MINRFRLTVLALGLTWATQGFAFPTEMFPEQATSTSNTNSPVAQSAIGVGELGAAAALFATKDPIEGAVARLANKLIKSGKKIGKLEIELRQASPTYQIEAINNSLATAEAQREVRIAESEVIHATALVTQVEMDEMIRIEQQMAASAGIGGIGEMMGGVSAHLPQGSQRFRIVSLETKEHEQSLASERLHRANAELDSSLKRVNGSREQIKLFPIQKGEATLRAELEKVRSADYAVNARETQHAIEKDIKKLEQKIDRMNVKTNQLIAAKPTLKAKIAKFILHVPVPAAVSGLLFVDAMTRAILYYEGRDPGVAPEAKIFADIYGDLRK